MSVICEITIQTPAESLDGYFNIQTFLFSYIGDVKDRYSIQTVDKALLLQGFAIVGTAFLI